MQYWLIYNPYSKNYLILDTKTNKSSTKWDSLDNIFNVSISDLLNYDRELYYINKEHYQTLIEFSSLPTYLEFCQAYPEFCI